MSGSAVARCLLTWLLVTLSLAASAQDTPEISFDQKTRDTIRSACHGWTVDMLPEALSWAKQWIDKNSPFCKDVLAQGYELDLESTVRRHKVPFTSERSKQIDRIYEAWRFRNMQMDMECRNEYMCLQVRREMADKNIPVTQVQYDQVAKHCHGRYTCIERWFKEKWENGVRTLPTVASKAPARVEASRGLDIETLMNGGGAASTDELSHDVAYGPDADFGNIHEGRQRIKVDNKKEEILRANDKLHAACQCTDNADGCYRARTFDNPQIAKSMMAAIQRFHADKTSTCNAWRGMRDNETASELAHLERVLSQRNAWLAEINQSDIGFAQAEAAHVKAQRRVDNAIAEAEQNKKGNGFMAAMGTLAAGAVVAGSLDVPVDADILANTAIAVGEAVENGDTEAALVEGTQGLSNIVKKGSGMGPGSDFDASDYRPVSPPAGPAGNTANNAPSVQVIQPQHRENNAAPQGAITSRNNISEEPSWSKCPRLAYESSGSCRRQFSNFCDNAQGKDVPIPGSDKTLHVASSCWIEQDKKINECVQSSWKKVLAAHPDCKDYKEDREPGKGVSK